MIISGVSGQIGSYFADFLLDCTTNDIIGLVRRESDLDNIKHINNDRFKLEYINLSNQEEVAALIKQHTPDYFINTTAFSSPKDCQDCQEVCYDLNVNVVANQLEAIYLYSKDTKYINLGSSEEFGDILFSPQTELHPLNPKSFYGYTKVAARQIVRYYQNNGIFACQPYLYNSESARRGDGFLSKKIIDGALYVNRCIKDNVEIVPISIGNIYIKKDWQDVEDVIRALWLILNSDIPRDYIVASGKARSIKDFLNVTFNILGIPTKWVKKDGKMLLVSQNAENAPRTLFISDMALYSNTSDKLISGHPGAVKGHLGWKSEVSFKDMIKNMVYGENKV